MFEAFEEDELRLTSMAYARYLVEIAKTIKNPNFQDMLPSLRKEYDAVTKLHENSLNEIDRRAVLRWEIENG
jgi:hypothetical protein